MDPDIFDSNSFACNYLEVEDEFLRELQMHRMSGMSGAGTFKIRDEHLIAKDKYGRSCLHIALLKTRNYQNYAQSLAVCSMPHPSRICGWPSLVCLESILSMDENVPLPWTYWRDGYDDFPDIPVDIDLVNKLIGTGADINAVDSKGNTCLHYAVENEDSCGLISMLIEAGAKFDLFNDYGDSPLHTAVKMDNIRAVDLLIKCGADINIPNKYGDTCLHLTGDDDILFLLMNAGCTTPMNHINYCGCSPFLLAISYCQVNTVIQMIQAGADVNFRHKDCGEYECRNWKTPLHAAIAGNRNEIVGLLLEHGANPNEASNRKEITYVYVESLNHSNKKAGHTEAESDEKSANILQLLITNGVNVCDIVEYFRAVIEKGNLRAVNLFLQEFHRKSLKVPVDIPPLLHLSILNKREDVFQFVLESNFNDLDEIDEEGYTAFHKALKEGKIDRAEMLLDYGADMNSVNNQGKTVLDSAIGCPGNLACVIFLLSHASLPYWRIDMTNIDMRFFQRQSLHSGREIEKIVMYLALVESLGRTIDHQTMSSIMSHLNFYREHYERCKIEIELAQKFVIDNSITVYDILTKVHHCFARNETLVMNLSSGDLLQHFPIYKSLISFRLAQSQKMQERLLKSVTSLKRILEIDYLSFHEIYQNILSRLSPIDLLNLHRI